LGKLKKIVLFIVEGITDEISLALVLSKIIEKDKTVIHLVDTDGAYISDNLILEKDVYSIEYTTQNIYAKNIHNI